MGDPIRFRLNGKDQCVTDEAVTRTLLDWLREDRRLTGTKEGCAEGDCGACTVAVRGLEDGVPVLRPVNACICLLPMVHGKEVITVEHLRNDQGGLHPVQSAMAEGHASQCGFCTPGFVMSLWTDYMNDAGTDRARIDDAISGNLCRCTGYGPIIGAAVAARDLPRPAAEQRESAESAACLRDIDAAPLSYAAQGRHFLAPRTLAELDTVLEAHPGATILAGATDVGLWVTKRFFAPETIIYLGRVAELQGVEHGEKGIRIGAMVRHETAREHLTGDFPQIARLLRRFGSTQVRAAGTVGGNIANGSPIGDLPPALIAAGARLTLRHGGMRRSLPLEDFFIEYGRQDRAAGEIVEAIDLPLPGADWSLACYKISKRFDQDISSVCLAISTRTESGLIRESRVALGGMAGIPLRARAVEAALRDQPFVEDTFARAAQALENDCVPLTDARASAGYRMTVAQNLILKYYIEQTERDGMTRIDLVTV